MMNITVLSDKCKNSIRLQIAGKIGNPILAKPTFTAYQFGKENIAFVKSDKCGLEYNKRLHH